MFTLAQLDEIIVDAYNIHDPINADAEGVHGSEHMPLSDIEDEIKENDDSSPINSHSYDETSQMNSQLDDDTSQMNSQSDDDTRQIKSDSDDEVLEDNAQAVVQPHDYFVC